MKNKILISILLIAAIFGFAVYHFFFDINAIKPGEAFAVSGWKKVKYPGNACHNFGVKKKKWNIKYAKGKKEVIFDYKGKHRITVAKNRDSYNLGGTFGTKHFYADVLPWISWGNSPADTTTLKKRLDRFYIYGNASILTGAPTKEIAGTIAKKIVAQYGSN